LNKGTTLWLLKIGVEKEAKQGGKDHWRLAKKKGEKSQGKAKNKGKASFAAQDW